MNTESVFFSGGGWLSVCVAAHCLSHMEYTQHWSGALLIKVAKVHSGRYNLAGELQQKRTRKRDGSVGTMKTAPCYRPYKSFSSIF